MKINLHEGEKSLEIFLSVRGFPHLFQQSTKTFISIKQRLTSKLLLTYHPGRSSYRIRCKLNCGIDTMSSNVLGI